MNVSLGEGVYPTVLLVRELVPGALKEGYWVYTASDAVQCGMDIAVVEAFDALFPAGVKAILPSQEEFYIYSHSCIVR